MRQTEQAQHLEAIAGVEFLQSSSGVPSIEFRKLTGIEWTFSWRNSCTTSTMSCSVSPMPTISPLHSSMPDLATTFRVCTRSS